MADALIERLAESFGRLRLGNPLEATTQLGPLVHIRAAANMSGQVKQATSQGARRVAGGSDPDGAFYAASVIVDQEASTDVSHNTEIFGPVLDIIPFDSVDRAVEIANASVYGLIGSVFSADIGRAMTIALEMQTGQVVINGTGNYRADESAWGGYKLSGNDREGLGLSLEEFMQTKTLTLRKAIKRG